MNLEQFLQKEFGFRSPWIKKLVGYDNSNYLIRNEDSRFVFKEYRYSKSLFDVLLAENEVLNVLKDCGFGDFPEPIPFSDGSFVKRVLIGDENHIYRMLTFLEGDFLGDTSPTLDLAFDIGAFTAKMDIKLKPLESYVLKARELEWDLKYFLRNKRHLQFIENVYNKNLVYYFFQQFQLHVVPILPKLRKQVVHNDVNEWNILLKNNKVVSGLIDFGDVTYSPLINEVAIAMTYIAYDKENPLEWAIASLKGYHSKNPIQEQEIEVLYYLIAARLCTSVCNSANAKNKHPENTYTSVSEDFAWSMLHKWIKLNPINVLQEFRTVIGLPNTIESSVKMPIAQRHKHLSPILSLSYKEPIQMVGSAFQYMYDAHGNTFLDAYNNIPHVGHCHPRVVEAGQKQMGTLNTNTRYLYDLLPHYAEALLRKFPKSLNKVFFVNSGSAASDLAIRMAKIHTGKQHIMVMEHGYHGNTQTAIDISDYKFNNKKGQGQKDDILKTTLPDAYRGKYGNKGELYAQDAIIKLGEELQTVAAFIAEPIVGCGGQVPLAAGYLKYLYPEIRKHRGLCISDEVQTGFGRLGDFYWGFEMHDVVPDIIILGKPMGNGHPIGAVVVTDEIAASFEKGVEFFSSFGGNPVSCAIGLSVLQVIEEEELQQNAKEVGDYYQQKLRKLQEKHPVIGDVRGSGLFIGIDIVHAGTKKTNNELAQYLKNELRHEHILISTDGPDDSVLKTKPPLCFTKNNVDTVINAIDTILSNLKS